MKTLILGTNTKSEALLPTKEHNKICQGLYNPISYSRNDTVETRREIVIHNAKYNCYCNNVCVTEGVNKE